MVRCTLSAHFYTWPLLSRAWSCMDLGRRDLGQHRSPWPSVMLILLGTANYFRLHGFSLPFLSSFWISPEILVTGIYVHQTQTSSKNYRFKKNREDTEFELSLSKHGVKADKMLTKCMSDQRRVSRIHREPRRPFTNERKTAWLLQWANYLSRELAREDKRMYQRARDKFFHIIHRHISKLWFKTTRWHACTPTRMAQSKNTDNTHAGDAGILMHYRWESKIVQALGEKFW